MTVLGIPKRLGHIWIGDRPPPLDWMNTWREKHPDWDYQLYDNAYLASRRWQNQELIVEYFRRGQYAGVADLMRYEILLDRGGFLPEADSVCLRPCDGLFPKATAYTVYESEERKPGLVSPFLAAAPGHPFLDLITRDCATRYTPETLQVPWRSVGNRYLMLRIAEHAPDIEVFPSRYFVPGHKSGRLEDAPEDAYAFQYWGTTKGLYGAYRPVRQARIRHWVLTRIAPEMP